MAASASPSRDEPSLTVIFFSDPTAIRPLQPLNLKPVASRGSATQRGSIVVMGPQEAVSGQATVSGESSISPKSEVDEAAGDQLAHALLFGRYLAQVQARIERAWQRPRTEIGAARFQCRVRVVQTPDGRVTQILYDGCSGADRWRKSLDAAIRTASPLPAPPDRSVYADAMSLQFESDPFDPRGSAEGFEPPLPASGVDGTRSTAAFVHYVQLSGASPQGAPTSPAVDAHGVYHLTIVGSPAVSQGPPAAEPLQSPEGAAEVTSPPPSDAE